MSNTLESLLRTRVKLSRESQGRAGYVEITPDFRVAVQESTKEGVRIIIHPMGYSGDTMDFIVVGNELRPAHFGVLKHGE